MSVLRAVVPFVDEVEAQAATRPEPFTDVVMLAVPMATYRALSDAAMRRNITVAQLLAEALGEATKR